MAFDIEKWKEQLANNFSGWRARMSAAGVNSAYYFIAASAFLPIAQAFQNGQLEPLLFVPVASGIGANLLANIVQHWRDEATAAVQLQEAVKSDPELQPKLDALLQQLDAISLAEKSLSETDRAWFAKTLNAELAQFKSGITYTTTLTGSGVVAQGQGAKAVGEQAVMVEGSVGGSINTGTVNYFYARYESPSGKAQLPKDQFERILREYLAWVVKAYGKARLYGLESMRNTREQPRRQLADVFVPLTLRRFSPPRRDEIEDLVGQFKGDPFAQQRAYLRAVESHRSDGDQINLKSLLVTNDRLAVIGGAGCGKSTLTAFIAASLAQSAFSGEKPTFDLPKGRQQLLPLLIPLRYLCEYQRLCAEAPREKLKNPRTGKLAGFIPWYLTRRSPALELSEDFFDRLLLGGGCLLVLDGLDEVVSRAERGQVSAQVEALANDIYPGNMLLVTARESGYREDAVFGDDFVRLDVQPLEDEQIEALAHNWCQQLYPESVDAQAAEIFASIHEINRRYESQGQLRLINTPLMTTMVISVKWGENELPRERAKLYEAAVKVILQAQYLENDEAQKELVNWGGEWEEQRDWLSFLALEMHRAGRDGAAIPEERVRAILSKYPGMAADKLEAFLLAVRLRGGLFDERGELFQFAHLTFQEFLAARLLAKQREKSFESLAGHANDSWWREVFLLIYGYAKMDWPQFSTDYLAWLSNLHHNETATLAGLELSAAALLEIERSDRQTYQHQAELLCKAFEKHEQRTPASLRVQAGNTLASLGDPRFDPSHWHLPTDDSLGFIHVPAGKFIMGSDNSSYDDEKPQHEIDLPEFWLAKHPVTVAQYRAFVEASGYETTREDSLDGILNHPVVNVTWYDALQYCDWLDGQLKKWAKQAKDEKPMTEGDALSSFVFGLSSGNLQVTLPSEAEWEKAARGRDGRNYPWGEKPDPNRANYDETGIGGTSPVGAFPGGASQYDLLDMSGNVWEWTRSEGYKDYPYNPDDGREDLSRQDISRALRGGSFYDNVDGALCASRDGQFPDYRGGDRGFRVMVSPLLFSHQ